MFSLDELSPRRQLGQLRDDLRDDKFGATLTIIKLALLIVSGATLLLILPKFAYSLVRAATDTGLGDIPIFWTVGRGWVDGLKPYIDLFDMKPPGIFMITALSEMLTNGNLLGVTVSVLATMLTGIVPLVFVIYLIRKNSLPRTDSLVYIFFFFSYGIMFSFFSCASMMPDSIGAGFASAYALVLAYSSYRDPQDPKWTIVLATGAMLLSSGIKEPFLFSCLAVSLVICENPPRFLKYFVIPLAVLTAGP